MELVLSCRHDETWFFPPSNRYVGASYWLANWLNYFWTTLPAPLPAFAEKVSGFRCSSSLERGVLGTELFRLLHSFDEGQREAPSRRWEKERRKKTNPEPSLFTWTALQVVRLERPKRRKISFLLSHCRKVKEFQLAKIFKRKYML